MAFTADDLAFFQQYDPTAGADPGLSAMSRAGEQLGNLPSNALSSLTQSLGALGGVEGMPRIPTPYNIPAPQNTTDRVTDFALGQAAPELAASLVPFMGVSKLAKAAKLGEVATNVLANAATGGFMGAKNNSGMQDAVSQGALGALLPYGRLARLPMSMAVGGLDAAASYAQDQNATNAGVRFVADTVFGQLPGKLNDVPVLHPEVPPGINPLHIDANPVTQLPPTVDPNFDIPVPQGPQLKSAEDSANVFQAAHEAMLGVDPYHKFGIDSNAVDQLIQPSMGDVYRQGGGILQQQSGPKVQDLVAPDLQYSNRAEASAGSMQDSLYQNGSLQDLHSAYNDGSAMLQQPGFDTQAHADIQSQIGQPPEITYGDQLDQVPDLAQGLQYGKSAEASSIPMQDRLYQNGSLQDLHSAYNEGTSLLQDQPRTPQFTPETPDMAGWGKGKINPIPEYQRTEGGFVLPDLQITGMSGVQPLIGGAIGAALPADTTEDRVQHALIGAAIGAGTGAITAHAALNPMLESASKIKGSIENPFNFMTEDGFEPHNFQQSDAQDVHDVIQGKKPMALAPKNIPENEIAVDKARKAGLTVDETTGGTSYIVYPESNTVDANTLNELRHSAEVSRNGWSPEQHYNYHKDMGTLLGYPAQEVETFSSRMRSMEMNKRDLQYSKQASDLGLTYDGMQHTRGMASYHQFTDRNPESPSSGTSFYMPEKFTTAELQAKLAMKQEQFGKSKFGTGGFGKSSTAGFLSTHAVSTLAGGTVGGVAGYNKSHGDPVATVEGALLGAGIGFFGATILEGLARGNPNVKTIQNAKGISAAKEETAKTLEKLMTTPLIDLAGETVNGRGGVLQKFVRMAEVWNNLHLPDIIRDSITRSKGAASNLADVAGHEIRTLGFDFEIEQSFKDATNRFLEGKFRPVSDIEMQIRSEGGVSLEDYRKIPAKSRPVTTRLEIGTRPELAGLGEAERAVAIANSDYKVYRIPEAGKTKVLEADQKAYTDFMQTHGHLQYSNTAVTARTSIMGLQGLVAEGLPEGSTIRRIVEDSIGQYGTRQFKLFNDNSYYPSDALIEKQIQEMGISGKQRLIDKSINGYDAYTASDYQAKLTKAQGSTSSTAVDAIKRLSTFVKMEHGGADFYVKPAVASKYELEFDDAVLRRKLGSYLNEAKANKGMLKLGSSTAKIDTTLLKEREQLTPTFREMIGEYTDPMHKLAITTNRLLSSAQTGRFLTMLEGSENRGLPMIFKNEQEWTTQLRSLGDKIKMATDPKEIAILQSQVKELKSYTALQANLRYGGLEGKIVSRFIQDQFNDNSGVWGVWDTPVGRSLAQANYITKVTHTVFNPATAMRNMVTMPMFAAIAKAGPAELGQAWKVLKAKSGPEWDEMMREGILGVDFVNAEMRQTVEKVFTGHYDSDVMKGFGKVKTAMEEFYRIPDMMVRAGAYLGAKKRFAAELNLPSDHPNVIAKAVHWVDRRTMNYGNMSKATMAFRQVPFANMYISYTSEVIRLTKNLVVDAAKGDLHAITALAGMYVVPDVMQRMAESQLSPKDKKDWDHMLSMQQDYTKDRYKLPTSRNKDGSFNYVDITPLLIANDFNQSIRAVGQRDGKVLAAVNPLFGFDNTPALKILAAQVAGKDLNTQRDFRGFSDRIQAIAGEIVPPMIPPGYEAKKLASIGETNLRTGRTETWGGTALRDLLGVNYTSVNPGIVAKQAMSELQSKLALEKRYFMDVAATNADPAKKARALQTYKEAVAYHLRDFYEKSGQEPPPIK